MRAWLHRKSHKSTLAPTVGLVLLGLSLLPLLAYAASSVAVSVGHRDGEIVKFSRKGLCWPTWEGELAMAGVRVRADGGAGSVWAFTVPDDATAARLNALPPGKVVRVHYREYLTLWPPAGDTAYFVTSVEVVP